MHRHGAILLIVRECSGFNPRLGGFDIVEVDVQVRDQVDSGEKVEARDRKEEDKTRTNNARSNM